MKYAAIVAAAGIASRMGEFKPMMKLGTSTIIDNVIENFYAAEVADIYVVSGYKADFFNMYLHSKGVNVCENKNFAETKMLDSVKIGLTEAQKKEFDYFFIMPGDVPLVRPETMEYMKTMAEQGVGIVSPSFEGRVGHPVLLKKEIAKQLSECSHCEGLRGFLKAHSLEIQYVNVDDKGILADADTKKDYKRLRQLEMEQKSRGKLWYEMDIRVSKYDTILTCETTQFLEMIEHTGSIQSACGCMHMSYTKGWSLLKKMEKDLGYSLTICSAGGEGGGGTCLSEKGRKLIMTYRMFTNTLSRMATTLFDEIFTEDLYG